MKVRIRRYRWHWHWLCNYWPLNKLSDWYDKRRVKVKYDPWDTWNLDNTLAHIILPGLKQLKEIKHGMPWVDNEDVAENLRIEKGNTRKEYYDNYDYNASNDQILLARWQYVQDEMIFAFQCLVDDTWEDQYFKDVEDPDPTKPRWQQMRFDKDGYQKEQERIQNGLRLFGKYYQSLWD